MATVKSEREELVVFSHDDTHATVYSFTPEVWKACVRAGGVETVYHRRDKGKTESKEFRVLLEKLSGVLNWVGEVAKNVSAKQV